MRTVTAILALLVVGTTVRGQTNINSTSVQLYRNNLPADPLFFFPLSQQSNILMVFIGCGESPIPNQVFVYEEQPDRSIKIYQFENVPVGCNENYDTGDFSLKTAVTVTTADHTVTIDSAAWTVVRGYHGALVAKSGSSTLTIN